MTASWEIREGDCCALMAAMPEASVDAIVCDPPYGIGFMGKTWDGVAIREAAERDRATRSSLGPHSATRPGRSQARSSSAFGNEAIIAGPVRGGRDFQAWCERWAREALRVLKPGGFLLAAGGTRTYHRLVCAVEDAGFEIRDRVLSLGGELGSELDWIYGSGFPKSLDVSKAIDKAAGAEREIVGQRVYADGTPGSWRVASSDKYAQDEWTTDNGDRQKLDTAPATPEAERWEGWGTALKPAHEPIVVARKPLAGNVATNVLVHGTGALNVDGCRIGFAGGADERESKGKNRHADFDSAPRNDGSSGIYGADLRGGVERGNYDPPGRWPANVVLAHADGCVLVGERSVKGNPPPRFTGADTLYRHAHGDRCEPLEYGTELVQAWECVPGCPVRALDEQSGPTGAAAPVRGTEASRTGQNGIYGYFERVPGPFHGDTGGASRFFYTAKASTAERGPDNKHPTVKPVDLMCWLVRLVTPPGGIVLDPFVGSGTTGIAALREGFSFIGLEREAEYVALARRRIIDDAPLLNAAAEVAA